MEYRYLTVRITLQTTCTVILPIDECQLTGYSLVLVVIPGRAFREESVGFLEPALASSKDCRLSLIRTIYENQRVPFQSKIEDFSKSLPC